MKTVLFSIVFFTLTINCIAQEKANVDTNDNKVEVDTTIDSNDDHLIAQHINVTNKDVCDAEKSKLHFYRALIKVNNFDIHIKDPNKTSGLALKNTEDIITNSKERISYSD